MCLTFQVVATFHLASPALPLCLCAASLTEVKQLASRPASALSSFPFNQILSLADSRHEFSDYSVSGPQCNSLGEIGTSSYTGLGVHLCRAEGDTDAVVDRQDERLIPFAPVLDHCDVHRRRARHDPGLSHPELALDSETWRPTVST